VGGDIVKTTVILAAISAILLFVAGCGPGEPFEIEGLHNSQSPASTQVAAAR
jgi:hypothetical protein